MGEALDEVDSLYRASGRDTPYDAVRSYVEAYSDALLGSLTLDSCEDPLTGLTTAEYLRTRLAEEYREAARDGVSVADTAALVVVDTPSDGRGRLVAAMGLIEVSDALRTTFSGGETCAGITPWRAVALVRRGPRLARSVLLLQELLREREPRLGRTRSWIEGLPPHECAAADLVAELAR